MSTKGADIRRAALLALFSVMTQVFWPTVSGRSQSLPTITVRNEAVVEPNVRATNLFFTATISSYTTNTCSVSYSTSNGTAQAGSDYVATNGVLMFPPELTSQTFSVVVKGDTVPAPDKDFYVILSSPSNALAGPPAKGTILNNDGLPGQIDHFEFSAIPTPQLVYHPIPVMITAKDAFNNTVTNFSHEVVFSGSSSDVPSHRFGFEEADFSIWTPLNGGPSPGPYRFDSYTNSFGELSTRFGLAPNDGTPDGITTRISLAKGVPYSVAIGALLTDEPWGMSVTGDTVIRCLLGGQEIGSYAFGALQPGFGQIGAVGGTFVAPSNGLYDLTIEISRPASEAPYLYAWLNDVRAEYPPIYPQQSKAFTNGIWSGYFYLDQPITNYALQVDDRDGHFGTSTNFTVYTYANVQVQAGLYPNPARVGSNFTMSVLVQNLGPAPASGVVVTSTLPPNATLLSLSTTKGNCFVSNGIVICEVGTLASGQAATNVITSQPYLPGVFTNIVSAWSDVIDPTPADNTASNIVTVAPPLIFIHGPTVVERTGKITNAVFHVSIGTAFRQPIDVDYETQDGTAQSGQDYVAAAGHLTFPVGVTNQDIIISVLDDVIDEPNETFAVQLLNPVNAELAFGGRTNCVILDNFDPPPVIDIGDAVVVEGDSGTTNALFPLSLSHPSGNGLWFDYSTLDGSAKAGIDYAREFHSLFYISAGVTNTNLPIAVFGNTVRQPDRTFFVSITNRNEYIGRAVATGTILDDDNTPGRLDHFEWSTVPEPQYATRAFGVTLTARDAFGNVYTGPVTNTVKLKAVWGASTNALTNVATFTSGVWTGAVLIATTVSNVVLRAEDNLFHVGTSNPFDLLAANALVVSVPASATEGDGVLIGRGRVSIPRAVNGERFVSLSSSDTSEVTVPSSVLIPAGESSASFDLTVMDDNVVDGSQTATITASASGYSAGSASITVHDNESAALALVVPQTLAEGTSYQGFVSNSVYSTVPVTIGLTSSDPRVMLPSTVTLPAFQKVGSLRFTITNDSILQGTTNVTITAHVENWVDGIATATLLDKDTNTLSFHFSGAGPVYSEATLVAHNCSIEIGGRVDTNVVVTLSSSDTTAVIVPSSLMIPAGATSAPVTLTIVDDKFLDGTQTAVLTATAPGFLSASVEVSVADNEVDHFAFSPLPQQVVGNTSQPLTITARDINDLPITGYSGYLTLSATDGNGNAVPLSPSTWTMGGGVARLGVILNSWPFQSVKLHVADTEGVTGQSGTFDVVPPSDWRFLLNRISLDPQGVVLQWPSLPAKTYTIFVSTNLFDFVPLADVSATPPQNTFTDTHAFGSDARFYRLQVH